MKFDAPFDDKELSQILDRANQESERMEPDKKRGKRSRTRSRSRSPAGHSRRGGGERRDGSRSMDRRSISSDNDRMVYISNIPYEIRWMELKDLIREKAGEVAFVEMLENISGRSKGCAVVEFRDSEGARKCVDNMNRLQIRDRYLVAKEIRDPVAFFRKVKEDMGVDFLSNTSAESNTFGGGGGGGGRRDRDRGGSGRGGGFGDRGPPPRPLDNGGTFETFGLSPTFLRQLGIEGPLCNRVFIANLPYNMQSGRIMDVFGLAGQVELVAKRQQRGSVGQVTWCDLQMDKEGKSKGFAVVEYSHPIEAVQAISMLNNKRVHDRPIAVKMDKYQTDPERARRPGELPAGLREVGMGLGANGAPLTNVAQIVATNTSGGGGMMNTGLMSTGTMDTSAFGGGGGFGQMGQMGNQMAMGMGMGASGNMMNTATPANMMGGSGGMGAMNQMGLPNMAAGNMASNMGNNMGMGGGGTMMGGGMGMMGGGQTGNGSSNFASGQNVGGNSGGAALLASQGPMGPAASSLNAPSSAMGGGGMSGGGGGMSSGSGGYSGVFGSGQGGFGGGGSGGGFGDSGSKGLSAGYGMERGGGGGGSGPFDNREAARVGSGGSGFPERGGFGSSFPDRGSGAFPERSTGAFPSVKPEPRGPSRTITIRNLPGDYTWQMVKERMKTFGDIEFTDMIGPGHAKVRFINPSSAETAIAQLDGMSVEGRHIAVESVF